MPPAQTMRSAVLFCVTAIVFAVCFTMLKAVIGGESPWLGLLLMFYFMGLAKVGEPLFVFRMPFVWARGERAIAALFLVIQVLFNIYPILHLRLLRGRLAAILARDRGDEAGPVRNGTVTGCPDWVPVNTILAR